MRNVTIVFVHVGKAGGDSILSALSRSCKRPGCNLRPQIHMRPVRLADLAGTSAVVVSYRDPVDRFVSAFNWRHPRGGATVHAMGGRPDPTNPTAAKAEIALYRCFEEPNEAANALWDETWCGVVARQALNEKEVGHIGKGLFYYFGNVLDMLERVPIFVVHASSIRSDMACLASKLGLRFVPPPHLNSDYARRNRTFLDATGREKLTHALANEYWLGELIESYSRCAGGMAKLNRSVPSLRVGANSAMQHTRTEIPARTSSILPAIGW
eukprot:Transcript_23269.p1 GENE.Transcript_23269~~Transcript_23269.p1  ORF type:complete len:269 (-),score=12.79 Transcript_23269:139-945(-)